MKLWVQQLARRLFMNWCMHLKSLSHAVTSTRMWNMYGRDYIDKHVMRRRVDPGGARITYINARSWYFIDEHGARVLQRGSDRVATIVTCRHVVVILAIGAERFHVVGCIGAIPRHINAADELRVDAGDYVQVGIVSSAMTRRERIVHLSPCVRAHNPRPNLITIVHGYTELYYDCTGCIPMRPSIPHARGIRCNEWYMVLVGARRRRRRRGCTVLLVWDPVTRFSHRIRARGYICRNAGGAIRINTSILDIYYTCITVTPGCTDWPNVYEN